MTGPLWSTPDEEYVDEYAAAVDRAKQTKGARMFPVRCASCKNKLAAAEVFDTIEGALFIAQIPQSREQAEATAVRTRTGKRGPYPTFGIAVLLERPTEPGMERPLRASCPVGRHGPLLVDLRAVTEAVANYRRRGRVAVEPIRALPDR